MYADMSFLSEFIFQGYLDFLGEIVSLFQWHHTIHTDVDFYRNMVADMPCTEVVRRMDFGIRKDDCQNLVFHFLGQ